MDYSTSTLLNISPYFFHEKSVDDELESLKIEAEDEIRRRDEQLNHVKELLYIAMVERDEALMKCQSLLQQQQQVNNSFTSSDCDDHSIVSSPVQNKAADVAQTLSNVQSFNEEGMQMQRLLPVQHYELPEKGKLLEAVMKAGPLLQTLLLTGHLPQWRHPPPPLASIEIPPVTIYRNFSRKRSLLSLTNHFSDSFTDQPHKLQKQRTQ